MYETYHQIVLLQESGGEGSKNFLPESNSSKTFWQLGCQVATLFRPLPLLDLIKETLTPLKVVKNHDPLALRLLKIICTPPLKTRDLYFLDILTPSDDSASKNLMRSIDN